MAAATRAGLRRDLAARLRAAGMDSPDLDARLLIAHALGLGADALVLEGDALVDVDARVRAEALVARRLAGEPVARLLGEKEFWSLPFRLSDETLVPRGDTETVVEEALARLAARKGPGLKSAALRILDLGTGSGAILAALLHELPAAAGIGVDRAEGAARAAQDNLARLGLGGRGAVVVGDWAGALAGPFDLVVSNPPYIPSRDIAALDVEVRAHDPRAALDGGADGLEAYRAILAALPRLLAGDGLCVLELGVGQEAEVAALAPLHGLRALGPARRDLGGIGRALSLARG